jgi:hypothetical protein
MSAPKDFFKGRVGNPEAMGQAEKDEWLKIEPVIFELVDELKSENIFRTSFDDEEIKHIRNMMDNVNQLSWNNALLFNIAADRDTAEAFLKATSPFGINEFRLVSLFIQQTIFYSITCIESFKTLLMFHLKDVKPKATFKDIIPYKASNAWKKLKPLIDSDFRNSFAHGTWAIEEDKKFVLFKNSKLELITKLTLAEFVQKTREQTWLYYCANYVLNEERKKAYNNRSNV